MPRSRQDLIQIIADLEPVVRLFGSKTLASDVEDLKQAKQELVSLGVDQSLYVTNFKEFREKYGVHYPGLLILEFIRKAPEFEGDTDLAQAIARMMADLENAR